VLLRKSPDVSLEPLRECDSHPGRPRPVRFARGETFFSAVVPVRM
jgi:hypothetical protein